MLKAVLFLALLPAVFAQPEDQPPAESTPSKAAEAAVGFQWKPALLQSGIFLGVQHVGRMAQAKTRRELAGPFWSDYFESASNIHTWRDGDGIPTNYLGHPVMGAVTGYIQVFSDPAGKRLEFEIVSKQYWKSRLKAMASSGATSVASVSP